MIPVPTSELELYSERQNDKSANEDSSHDGTVFTGRKVYTIL